MDTHVIHTKKSPAISVVMPIYNSEAYIKEAIDSILAQTFTDFEFIIIDDGSSDNGFAIAKSYTDPRIIAVKNEHNIGLALSINRGIDMSRGRYIARMDQDDISLPDRFSKQYTYMESHPDIAILGAWALTFGSGTHTPITHPTDPKELKVNLLFRTSLVHPTIFIRTEFLKKYAIRYGHMENNKTVGYIEDYDFYTRCSQYGNIANLGEVLLYYRRHAQQTSVEKRDIQIKYAQEIIKRQLQYMGIKPTPEELHTMVSIKRYLYLDNPDSPTRLNPLLVKIRDANLTTHTYSQKALEKILGDIWLDTSIAYYSHNKRDMWNVFTHGNARTWVVYNLKNLYRIGKLYLRHIGII